MKGRVAFEHHACHFKKQLSGLNLGLLACKSGNLLYYLRELSPTCVMNYNYAHFMERFKLVDAVTSKDYLWMTLSFYVIEIGLFSQSGSHMI